ncbi:glutathione S-transferase LANCL1 isoform X1 [Chelonia mydas]|uniref:glutathione S-transferase LANCL1 isoform X1 n=1 Tax=Chelonia mydas TaxID=8469 RepID=UPI001CA7CE64|nr:glutathione S-transferase LANCL1 isoform X1 [Chelonia mydas]XP_043381675.1 glutathione S-transferase LANCL1 isoform X1 [Chelonia mydas]
MAQRAFPNPYADYDKSLATGYFDSSGRLTPEFTQRLNNKIRELLQQMERGLKSADPRDCTGYTGWADLKLLYRGGIIIYSQFTDGETETQRNEVTCQKSPRKPVAEPGIEARLQSWHYSYHGIAVLYLHLYDVYGDPSYLQVAEAYAKKSLNCLTKRSITFLCGDAGPLAVAAVVYHRLQDETQSEACITRLLQLHKLDPRAPDEMLYGRMGYLYALLFVNKHYGEEKIPQNYIQQVCDAVVASGESLAKRRNFTAKSPLMYEWYQEYYIGAAHGLAGIYYYLMQPGLGVSQVKLHNTVKPSVDYVCQLKFPSGNYPPCIDDARDLLVHWCHGAPGVIYMLTQAYKVFADQQYLSDALQCAEVIWQWGLLKKGYGLCHGTAGNAYAFLMLYNLTQNMKYLYRACKFAEWCLSYGEHGCRTPDTPFSLFEGMAGTIYFLADLLVPKKAKFPAFEL